MMSLTEPTFRHNLAWSSIIATGDDALSFMQGQVAQDLRALANNAVHAALLNPDSTVLTAGVISKADNDVVFTIPSKQADEALQRLQRFRLRVDCRLSLAEASHVPFATAEELLDAGQPGAEEFNLGLTPHSYGSSFVNQTISFTKGCFTGQELVGRLDARRASVPWRLVICEGPRVERINELLKSVGPEGPQGVTTSVVSDVGVKAMGFAHRTLLDASVLRTFEDVLVRAV